MASPGTLPILLDTDPGSDIDDALAIAYLLRQPRCELVGITTVTGEHPEQRAQLAAAICEDAGRDDVPIHVGSPGPLLPGYGPGQPLCPQHAAIQSRTPRTFEPGTAVEFMRQTIRSRPGEITLLGIGPMTNLAILFAIDPGIPALLKDLVLMCGVFGGASKWGGHPGGREWNAMVDPIATAMVYAAHPPAHISIGLDVTTQVQQTADVARRDFAQLRGMDAVRGAIDVWLTRRDHITFHDPLAAAVIFEPDLCEYADGRVTVETASPHLGGLTHFHAKAETKPHRIATKVDAPRFFDHYFGVLAQ